jgi:glycosyltransferase involved in cell wall biosynthesis
LKVSVVIPLYNEEESLAELHERLTAVFDELPDVDPSMVYVDDGSTDGSLRILEQLFEKDRRVKVLSFRGNLGKSAALAAGFQAADGDVVITMDADLQDDPKEIPRLLKKLDEGFDLVSGWKKKRHDPWSKTLPSKLFNKTTSLLTGIKIHDFNCGFKAYRGTVTKEIRVYGELHRYMPVLANWLGFRIGEIEVEHHARKFGKTKFGLERFTRGMLDLVTILFLKRYLKRPLHFFGAGGLLCFLAGFVIEAYFVVLKIAGHSIGRRPLFFLGILLIIVGLQLFSLGLLGEMIVNAGEARPEFSFKKRMEH